MEAAASPTGLPGGAGDTEMLVPEMQPRTYRWASTVGGTATAAADGAGGPDGTTSVDPDEAEKTPVVAKTSYSVNPAKKPGYMSRVTMCLRHWSEKEFHGAKLPELVPLTMNFVFPVADVSSDWPVLLGLWNECAAHEARDTTAGFEFTQRDWATDGQMQAGPITMESPCAFRN